MKARGRRPNAFIVLKCLEPSPAETRGTSFLYHFSNETLQFFSGPVHPIPFQTKTKLFCSVFKKICVHAYRFRIVFARPHYNNYHKRSHMEPSVRHFGYSRSSGLAPGRVYLDDVTVFR